MRQRPRSAGDLGFARAVFALVRRVPTGAVVTYGQVAVLLGAPRAARAVGQAMRHCAAGVPWHRVVNRRGEISLRANASGMLTQRLLLEREGVRFLRGRVDLGGYRWAPPPRPARPRGTRTGARPAAVPLPRGVSEGRV